MATRAPELDGLHRYLVAGTRVHDRLAQAGGFVRTPQGEPLDIGVHVVRGYRGPVHVVDWTNPKRSG